MIKLKKFLFILLRISLLIVIIVLGFTAIFPGWLHEKDIIINDLANKFRSNEEILIREQAKRLNISYEQHLEITQEKQRLAQLKQEALDKIDLALEGQNPSLLNESIQQLALGDIPTNIFERTIALENIQLISALNETLPCSSIQSLKSTNYFSPIAHINSANRAIQATQNKDLIHYWVNSGCYLWDERNFVKRILKQEKESLLNDIPVNQSTEKFWQQVLDESIDLNKTEYLASLFTNDFVPISTEAFLKSIERGLSGAVDAIIESNPSYIRDNDLVESTINALYKVRNQRGGVDIRSEIGASILKSDLSDSLNAEQVSENVDKAIRFQNVHVFRVLLAIDPSIDVSGYEGEQLARLNAFLHFRPELLIRLQQQHGLDLKKINNEGLNQLSLAMSKGDNDLVDQLLAIGVNPRKFYKQGSILDNKIGGDESTVDSIKASLIKAGATQDISLLVHEYTGKTYDPSCKIGEASVSDFNSAQYLGLIDTIVNESKSDKWSAYEICESTLLICSADQNNNLDNCFESMPSCSSEREISGFDLTDETLTTEQLCCPASAKTKYNEMRCAGLGVIQSAWTIDGFTTSYSVPIVILNTKEYKEASQEQAKKRAAIQKEVELEQSK